MGNIHIDDRDDPVEPDLQGEGSVATPPVEDAAAEKKTRKPRLSWRQWLETDDAIRMLYLVFGFFVIVLVMVLLQFSTRAICCGDWDGYYHIRWSALLWESLRDFKGLPDFTWLPLTVLNPADYADHHFLFHLLQIPFLWLFEPVMAAKIAAVFYGSLAIFSVYWLMFRYKVDHLLIWLAALLTCANPFWYRMNMAKAPPLTIIYSIIGIYLLFERRYVWLLPLMFIFVWTYSLFPLLFVAALIWVAIVGWNERVFEWRPLAYTFTGMVLGNVINPYFPNNLLLLWEHFYTKFRDQYEVAVGGEWYSYTGWQLVTHLTIALIAMLVGYLVYKTKGDKLPERSTFFLVFATLLLIWMFKSKRLAEYFPPFAVLFACFSWQVFKTPDAIGLPEEFQRELEPLLDADKKPKPTDLIGYAREAAPWIVGSALVILLIFNLFGSNIPIPFLHKGEDLRASIRNNEKNDKYFEAMEWAKKNIPAGERIFNANWDDFPKLFFLNTQNSYVYGLDPNYLYSQDPELYKLLRDITSGKRDEAGPIIRDEFGTKWVFADADENEDMLARLLESGWADTVYEDGEAYILRIRDAKGVPAAPDPIATPSPEETPAAGSDENSNIEEETPEDPLDEEADPGGGSPVGEQPDS